MGHFNFVCTEVCGHSIGKLTHPQTKVGLSINKNRPIPRLCTIKHEPILTKTTGNFIKFHKNHPFPGRIIDMVTSLEVLCITIMTHP